MEDTDKEKEQMAKVSFYVNDEQLDRLKRRFQRYQDEHRHDETHRLHSLSSWLTAILFSKINKEATNETAA